MLCAYTASDIEHISEYKYMELKLKKGLDLPIAGGVNGDNTVAVPVDVVAVIPDDFPGFIPKVEVREGDTVQIGQALMHHKECADLKLVSPVSGIVKAVVRGERRKVLRIEVETSGNQHFTFPKPTKVEEIARVLAQSGLMAMMRQRPYDIVPMPTDCPRDIFVTAFDSAPLAATKEYTSDQAVAMGAAVKWLSQLTAGKVYISRRSAAQCPDVSGAVMVDVKGPHPAGLAGVQIANIRPVNKGEKVWTLTADTLINIGILAQTGTVSYATRVAVVGPEVTTPYIANTVAGAAIAPLLKGHLTPADHHIRVISGNVLTGVHEQTDGFLHYPYTQVTVIAEGDDVDEFMGWASISPKKMSVHPSYPGSWFKRLFRPDARMKGGRRAMIMSGEYDKYLPMDILPEYLLKAIQSGNIDSMEQLGIYEVAPEDFALAEYADSSKLPLQQIVRQGLDYLRHEVE